MKDFLVFVITLEHLYLWWFRSGFFCPWIFQYYWDQFGLIFFFCLIYFTSISFIWCWSYYNYLLSISITKNAYLFLNERLLLKVRWWIWVWDEGRVRSKQSFDLIPSFYWHIKVPANIFYQEPDLNLCTFDRNI